MTNDEMKELSEIRQILDYHTKLLEDLVTSIDDGKHRASRQKARMRQMARMLTDNPILKHPEAASVLGGIMGPLKAFMDDDEERGKP